MAATGLRVRNSLTNENDVFTPADGRQVKWYTCGPTVYDACHMGHARAYLTFDILRRIVEDYLHYDVLFQVNITDIDDKIIKRARQNALVELFAEESEAMGAAGIPFVEQYVARGSLALRASLEAKVSAAASAGEAAEAEDLEEERYKLAAFQQRLIEAEQNESGARSVKEAMEQGAEALAFSLEVERGHVLNAHDVFEAHARKFEREFFDDMDRLGVRRPDVVTRVTEYVPEIVAYIARIMSNGYAYASGGSVYFDTDAFQGAGHHYRKLMPSTGGAGGGGEEDAPNELGKRNARDFALWKASKDGEPAWASPWGNGRPGWHIECSVMASDVLGEHMDIHGGGVDLKFPHHDNELAQSEAHYNCHEWVKYFLHAGHLHIKGLKMSKSLKNFITIRQALEEHTPRQLRLMFLLQAWDKGMNYSDQAIEEAKSKESSLRNFFSLVNVTCSSPGLVGSQGWTEEDRAMQSMIAGTQDAVHNGFLDNFNTPASMTAIFRLISEVNKYVTRPGFKSLLVRKAADYIAKIFSVLGVVVPSDEGAGGGGAEGSGEESVKLVGALVGFRDRVRAAARGAVPAAGVLAECDFLRDDVLPDLGIRVEDKSDGAPSQWTRDNPKVLKQEIVEMRAQKEAAARLKSQRAVDAAAKQATKLCGVSVAATDYFLRGVHEGKWQVGGENNLPVALADGSELTKGQVKSNLKDLANYSKSVQKVGADVFNERHALDVIDKASHS